LIIEDLLEIENKRPAIFLDRDGVIIFEKEFLADPGEIEFIPGSLDGLRMIGDEFMLIVISNQSGVARGYFKESDVLEFNKTLGELLAEYGISVTAWYFCPHGPDSSCACRKPSPGMILQASSQFYVDLERSWMVGDKSSDIAAGRAAGLKTILVRTGYTGREPGGIDIIPDFIADNLYNAVELIIKGAWK